jgi:hypothetical protein
MMFSSLKAKAQLLSKKYSWHTLGENLTTSTQDVKMASNHETAFPKLGCDIQKIGDMNRKKRAPVTVVKKISGASQIVDATLLNVVTFKPNTKSKKLMSERSALTQDIYKQYNEMAFEGLLPPDLTISWSKRLTSTAGTTVMSLRSKNKVKVTISSIYCPV